MENKIKSYLTFKIGSEIFGANVTNIQTILEYTKLTKVPEMPSFIIGVMNLRGEAIPVIDSRIKLGITVSEINSDSCIIVVEFNIDEVEIKTGILVDEVSEVLEINDSDIKSPPSIGFAYKSDIITGVLPADDKFILLLDILKIASTDEVLSIA